MAKLRPNRAPERSLADEFGPVADEMRQLLTDSGMRPYRVFAVVVEHSGGEEGRGNARVVSEVELLPTPLVSQRGVRTKLGPGGKSDRGFATISEVSTRYTEEQLQRSFHVKPITEGVEAFYEVRLDARDGKNAARRRYALRDVPELDQENFQWVLRVSPQDQKRSPSGELNKSGRRRWQPKK